MMAALPRKTEWTNRLDQALEELGRLRMPWVDRAGLARLLGVSNRQALRILHRLNPVVSGHSLMVSRAELVAQLTAIRGGEVVQAEKRRLLRITAELEQARTLMAARRVTVPDRRTGQPPGVVAQLSEDICLQPGRLEIRFSDGADLLAKLLELARSVASDDEAFSQLTRPAG